LAAAIPPKSEPTVKTAMPVRNALRRPRRSPARAPRRSSPPKVRMYALRTHDRLLAEKWRPRWMWGRATFTIVVSSTTISWAVRTTARNVAECSRRRAGRPAAGERTGDCEPPGRLREGEGIDFDLSAGIFGTKRKLPPVTIRRVPPFSKEEFRGSAMKRPTPPEALPDPAGSPDDSKRHLRADARRNYERLVEAAHVVFARDGGGASMEAVAREAGGGVGTLYRHFPKRIDLVEAVYRTDVDELAAVAEKAVANLEPWPAVEAFTQAFRRYASTKRTFLTELHEAFEKSPDLKSRSRERIDQAWN